MIEVGNYSKPCHRLFPRAARYAGKYLICKLINKFNNKLYAMT